MNREAMLRILNRTRDVGAVALAAPQTPATCDLPCHTSDPLTALLNTRLKDLTAPLRVHSAILGEAVWLVATDQQGAAIEAKGGTAYTPPEVSILRDLAAAVSPEVWAERLRLIHQAKKEFQGKLEP